MKFYEEMAGNKARLLETPEHARGLEWRKYYAEEVHNFRPALANYRDLPLERDAYRLGDAAGKLVANYLLDAAVKLERTAARWERIPRTGSLFAPEPRVRALELFKTGAAAEVELTNVPTAPHF